LTARVRVKERAFDGAPSLKPKVYSACSSEISGARMVSFVKTISLTIAVLAAATLAVAETKTARGQMQPVVLANISAGPRDAEVFGRPTKSTPTLRLGVYDPGETFANVRDVSIEHVFVYWQALDSPALESKLRYAAERSRQIMITVEPYTRAENWRDGSERLFGEIEAGAFDAEIDAICKKVSGVPGHPLIRWGHEMEDANGRYPWARRDPAGYVAAYRHVVDRCRERAPSARFIWSPKGESNLADFYPGDAYVDVIGLSVWGLEKADQRFYGHRRRFSEALGEKYHRVARFSKPVVIAELGVAGGQAYRKRWLEEIAEPARIGRSFPLLRDIVYFNDKEPYHWPMGLGSPDWRINPHQWKQRADSFHWVQTASAAE